MPLSICSFPKPWNHPYLYQPQYLSPSQLGAIDISYNNQIYKQKKKLIGVHIRKNKVQNQKIYFNSMAFSIKNFLIIFKQMGNCQNNPSIIQQLEAEQKQTHLIEHWNNISSSHNRKTFEKELIKLNDEKAYQMYQKTSLELSKSIELTASLQSEKKIANQVLVQLPSELITNRSEIEKQKSQLQGIGLAAIERGEVAVFLFCQQNLPELDIDIPIGIFDIGLDSACTMIEIIIHKLSRLCQWSKCNADKKIKLYVITSSSHKQEIKGYLKSKNYFEYGKNNIFFLSIPETPIYDQSGKVVLKQETRLYTISPGSGAIYNQIRQKKIIDHLDKANIKYIHFCPVNNLLLKVSDPLALGFLIKNDRQVVSNCYKSNDVENNLFGLNEKGKIQILNRKSMKVKDSWISAQSCFMRKQFLQKLIQNQAFIKKMNEEYYPIFRQAFVYSPYFKERVLQKCVFFENFYHSAFEQADNLGLLQISCDEEFALIRNNKSNGKYSAGKAKNLLWKFTVRLIELAGISIVGEGYLQIHPRLTYSGENLQQVLNLKGICEVKLPMYIK